MLQSRRFFLSLLGVVTWAFNASFSILAILDAILLTAAQLSFSGLAIAAAALDGVSLCCIGYLLLLFIVKEGSRIQRWNSLGLVTATCALPSVVAMLVSLTSLLVIKFKADDISRAASRAAKKNWTQHLPLQFALWALALATQIAFFTLILTSPRSHKGRQPVPSDLPRDSVMSEVREMTPPTSMRILAPKPFQTSGSLGALPSPTLSSASSKSLKSWRDSLQQIVRPITSRTRLVGQPSFTQDSRSTFSGKQSMDVASQSDAFDSWDTSHVDPETRDTVMSSGPSRGTALETIPGSRPASPAHALDGPFSLPSDGRESPALSLPPKIYADSSRPPSPAGSEANIHPLFRAESPVPPPAATPGTVITGVGGQIIACPPRPYSRMRSNSRTASPSRLMHSQSFTGRQRSASSPSSRSSSPPSRPVTPPIPEFILKSSPRTSISGGSQKKKIILQPEANR